MRRALVAAAVAGAAGMAVELLALRALAPAFGTTLSTWAWLIAATLLAGAVGALVGARASRAPSARRTAAALLLAAAATGGLAVGHAPLVGALLPLPIELGTALGALALVTPAVLPCAAVLPLAVAQAARRLGAGPAAGRALCASTAGSLVGTLGTALALLPALGVAASAGVVAAALAATALLVGARRAALALLAALGGAAGLGLVADRRTPADVLLERPSAHGLVSLVRRGDAVVLTVDGVAQGTRDPGVESLAALRAHGQHVAVLPVLHPRARTALVVGLGAGLLTSALAARGLDVTTVEVDDVVADVVRGRWGVPGTLVVGDGRAVWRRTTARFDLVALDAFAGEGLPAHLLTREAFDELRARLTPGGLLCVHLVGEPAHAATAAVAATLAAAFPHTLATRAGSRAPVDDLFLLASDTPVTLPPDPALDRARAGVFAPPPGVVVTDDRNPLDRLHEPVARRLRALSRRDG